jgi:ATP-dependent helicase/nuclease subunit A
VDRLAVTRDSVLIADYKTDRTPPGGLAEVPERYTGQLALYRSVLGRVYPGKTIRAALIFTEGPTVIELPRAILDASLAEALAR